jgi:serine/threonine-protein kinase
MGVVYLAHDTKLDRQVAIKSLPAELMDNPKARSRFSSEARVLASLNHPNIATIYEELKEAEGVGFLVLEYIPGDTLAERIGRKKLKVKEALTIGLQIAEGVAAAHEHGVIHRDLKAGNIKITPEGKVKVLDFGLAKAVGGETLNQQSTITEPGRIIGTPAYMSPEQARGERTDERSDIWSFGCVLYEMLTGSVPFEGGTPSDTLANILTYEPDWQALPKSTPANIPVLLRRCLTKDPRRRLQHIGDASIEISETLNLPATAPPVTTTSLGISRPRVPRQLVVLGVACSILVVVVISLVIWNLKRPLPSGAPLSQPARRFIIRPETSFEFEALWHRALALSPDGRQLACVEEGSDKRRRIYLRKLDEFTARPLAGTEGAISPFFSPDGQWVGYVDHFQRKLKKVSVKGGEPMILCECLEFRGGSWGTDDTIIFTPASLGGLWRISASGEGLEELTVPDANQGELGHIWPQILPGGKAVLFTNKRKGGLGNQFEVYSLETRQRRPLFKPGTCARYVPTGHIVYARKKTLYAVRFDIEQLKVVGSAVTVVPDVMSRGSTSAQFAISRDGTLAYIPVQARSAELRPVWVDRNGQVEPLPGATPRGYDKVRISPDGVHVAFAILDGDNRDVWIYDLTRRTLNPLTSDGKSRAPIWTPDGKRVVFCSYRTGQGQLFAQNVDGSGEPELLATVETSDNFPSSCSPDGKEILLLTVDPKRPMLGDDISVLSFEKQNGKPHLRPFIQRNLVQRHAAWFPDGRWVAYSSDESRRWEVYVEPYPGPGPKIMVSTGGGYQPVWSRDGKKLFYRSGNKMIAATIETKPEFKVINFEELFEGRYLTTVFHNYDVSSDGRFLMIQEPQESTPLWINVVLNWFEELKRLVPTGKK